MSVWVSAVLLCLVIATSLFASEPWEGPYVYDGAGNIRSIGTTNLYFYDSARRLRESAGVVDAQNVVRNYSYDAFGNLREVQTNHDAAHATVIGSDPWSNQVIDASRCQPGTTCIIGQYDAAGHQIGGQNGALYDYDAIDMMSSLDAGSRHEVYVYDADDQRIVTVANATTTPAWRYTLRDRGASVVREWTSSAPGSAAGWSWTKDYVYREGVLLASIADNAGTERRTHFHVDHLSTPRLLTDDEGQKIAAHTYWPFGLEAADSSHDSEPMKYTGHERDFAGPGNVNDLDYMHARFYSPTMGRFTSTDPVGGVSRKPQTWNRYAYVLNNPMTWVDPFGLVPCWVMGSDGKRHIGECITVRADPWVENHLPGVFPGAGFYLDQWWRSKFPSKEPPKPGTFTKAQCHALEILAQREQTMGTTLTAGKSGNTFGDKTIAPFNVDFGTRGNAQLPGGTQIDIDWFTEISAYTRLGAVPAYIFGKWLWKKYGGTSGSWLDDPGETTAVYYATKGASYMDIYNEACH